MAGVSLESSIRTCKIDPAYAAKIQSDRFLNPYNMVCPVWNGVDSAGRYSSVNTVNTKSAGCVSAYDRIYVENNQRPQYMEYINLSSEGIHGNIYSPNFESSNGLSNPYNFAKYNSALADEQLDQTSKQIGNFGVQLKSQVAPKCGSGNFASSVQKQRQIERVAQSQMLENQSASFKAAAGNGPRTSQCF